MPKPHSPRLTRRNDRCPCGSGRKFKQCCRFKRPIRLVVSMDDVVRHAMKPAKLTEEPVR